MKKILLFVSLVGVVLAQKQNSQLPDNALMIGKVNQKSIKEKVSLLGEKNSPFNNFVGKDFDNTVSSRNLNPLAISWSLLFTDKANGLALDKDVLFAFSTKDDIGIIQSILPIDNLKETKLLFNNLKESLAEESIQTKQKNTLLINQGFGNYFAFLLTKQNLVVFDFVDDKEIDIKDENFDWSTYDSIRNNDFSDRINQFLLAYPKSIQKNEFLNSPVWKDFRNDKSDMVLLVNGDEATVSDELNTLNLSEAGVQLDKLVAKQYSKFQLNLNDGEFNLKTTNYLNAFWYHVFENMSAETINMKLKSFVKEEKVPFISVGKIKTDSLWPALIEAYSPLVNSLPDNEIKDVETFLSALEVFVDEDAVLSIFNGDFLLALTGTQIQKITYTDYEMDEEFNTIEVERKRDQVLPKINFVLGLGNPDYMKKILSFAVSQDLLLLDDGIYKIADSTLSIINTQMFIDEDYLIISNDSTYISDVKYNKLVSNYNPTNWENLNWQTKVDFSSLIAGVEEANLLPMPGVEKVLQYLGGELHSFESAGFTLGNENQVTFETKLKMGEEKENSMDALIRIVNGAFMATFR